MPELDYIERHQKEITRIEQRVIKELEKNYRELRLALLDIVERVGISSPYLSIEISRAAQEFARSIPGVTRQYVEPLAEAASSFFGAAIGQVNRSKIARVNPESFFATSTPASRADIARALEGAASLGEQVSLTLSNSISQIQLQGQPEQIAMYQLLGTNQQSGRASSWARAGQGLLVATGLLIWAIDNRQTSYYTQELESSAGLKLQKQAIAAIDERTTDCCLRVHGQIKPLDKPFELSGSPRFADEIMRPPFHWHCRTSQALYNEAFEDIGKSTRELREAARAELEARELTGQRAEIHPSSATSRR